VMKKLLLFIIANVFFFSYANAEDKVGMTQEVGLSIPYYYQYSEPEFMYMEADFEEDAFESYGLTYNIKNAFLYNGFLNELELDISWQYFKHDYWANTSDPYDDLIFQVWNARALYGLQISDRVMLKTGFGYRNHDHQWGGASNWDGCAGCYDRGQVYHYIPFIAELDAPIGNNNGKLKIEFDNIYYGKLVNGLTQTGSTPGVTMRNDDGYMWKTSYKFPFQGFYFEPYYEFIAVEESDKPTTPGVVWQEPSNITHEYGLKFSKRFGEDSLSAAADSRRLYQGEEKYYFGIELFQSKLDTGIYGLAGGATLDEKDLGVSILSGFKINDFIGIEAGFTEFGQAMIKSDNGGSFKTDARYRHGLFVSGGTVSIGSDDFREEYESYSASLALKPHFDLENGLFVNADLGMHGWKQEENYRFLGAAAGGDTMVDYAGVDGFYGFGAGLKKDNFEVSVNYKDYDMYYDAEIIGASLKYNF